MEIYLVGGAVRDKLLGRAVIERDWVVVGATPEQMLAQGFQPVGKEFPVFLHPKTKEEYALARTERKVGKGYKGFVFYADSAVTLVQDLQRRDLTINAMAETPGGEIIDPYGGLQDLKQRLLRHVSPAFAEDPVRILRVARFAAKLPDFEINSDTYALMRDMVAVGEVDALVPERVWQEVRRALAEPDPERFWGVLATCGALEVLFPALKLTPLTLQMLARAVALTPEPQVRFAALMHELKLEQVRQLAKQYRLPAQYTELAELVVRFFPHYQTVLAANAEQIWELLKGTDALRRPQRFAEFLLACQACCLDSQEFRRDQRLQAALDAVLAIDTKVLQAQGFVGAEFGRAIKQQQLVAIAGVLS